MMHTESAKSAEEAFQHKETCNRKLAAPQFHSQERDKV